MKKAAQRGESEIAGMVGVVIFGLFIYGLCVGTASLWKGITDATPAAVECYAGGRELYSGITTDGVSTSWKRKTVTEYGTGKAIRLDENAVCVERALTKAEVGALQAGLGRR